jgi:hypothetical protein
LAVEFADVFRSVVAEVDAKLVHNRDSFRTNEAGVSAGASDFEAISGKVAQQPFGHLAAGGVAGT